MEDAINEFKEATENTLFQIERKRDNQGTWGQQGSFNITCAITNSNYLNPT